MSGAETPPSAPRSPPLGAGGHLSTQPNRASVDDMFDLAAPPVEAPLVGRLVPVLTGGDSLALAAIPLHQDQGTAVIGRSKELPPPFRIDGVARLSGKHCEVAVDAMTLRVTVRDTSSNGTFVNGERLAKNGAAVALRAGDSVSLTRPQGAEGEEHVEFLFQRLKEETDVRTMVDELTCGVCLQLYHRPVSMLPCMHVLCAGCVSDWLKEDNKACPECRQTIAEVRPTHKIQSCVDQLLLAEPSRRRAAEDVARLDAADTIPPAGKVLVQKRARSGGDSDGDDNRSNASAGSDGSGSGLDEDAAAAAVRLLHPGVHYGAVAGRPQHPLARCPQCDHASTLPDHFRCVEGGPHLCCSGCRRQFPERPLCGRPQRCHLCSAPYCGMYFAGETVRAADGAPSYMPKGCAADGPDAASAQMQPLCKWAFAAVPPRTFGGNITEISILTTHLATRGTSTAEAWRTCLEQLRSGAWKPDLPSVNGPLTADSAVCRRCADSAFAALLFHYRRAIPREELPESVAQRSNCWYGLQCRTQFHKVQHAQNFNHVCYQEKRKE